MYFENKSSLGIYPEAAINVLFALSAVFAGFYNGISFTEEKWYAPKGAKTHNSIDYSAYHSCLTSEDPGNYIKFEKSDTAPVDTSDY